MAEDLKKAYSANITISFLYGEYQERYDINPQYISYISIVSNYENQVIPVIMISMNVEDDLYELLLKYKTNSKFYFSISKSNVLSSSSLFHESFSDYFSFIMSDNSPNMYKSINENQGRNGYRRLLIGLISYKMINNNRITFNGIYKNIDTNTLIHLALEGINCICHSIKYNTEYDTLIIPPITTRYKFLSFIQNLDPFFDTKFKYFMDFDTAYLTDENYTDIDEVGNIIINIRDIEDYNYTEDGISFSDNTYYIEIPTSQYQIKIDQYKEKILDKIIGVDEDYNLFDEYNFDKDDLEEYSISKDIFIRTDSTNIIKNEIESNKLSIILYKANIDGSIFTPDKYIKLKHYDDNYIKYNGEYKLVDKKEVFSLATTETSTFNMAVMLTLKPIGNISPYIEMNYKKEKQYISDTTINKNINVK